MRRVYESHVAISTRHLCALLRSCSQREKRQSRRHMGCRHIPFAHAGSAMRQIRLCAGARKRLCRHPDHQTACHDKQRFAGSRGRQDMSDSPGVVGLHARQQVPSVSVSARNERDASFAILWERSFRGIGLAEPCQRPQHRLHRGARIRVSCRVHQDLTRLPRSAFSAEIKWGQTPKEINI